jgi:hypothetical protein
MPVLSAPDGTELAYRQLVLLDAVHMHLVSGR